MSSVITSAGDKICGFGNNVKKITDTTTQRTLAYFTKENEEIKFYFSNKQPTYNELKEILQLVESNGL